ncbi:4'-phosphopantetheinyl transferase superfamily protein [Aquabacterium sp. A7-Y]|uniref:4'-phosphopantetheinyl transferase family protein n=1 Tax=Aquabacterium sp. A7-Y TaxID=1349605 RepID=UPI00223E1F6A|nr:4'-phosphopantetheinyl transferase superfamily protein [Aquabacterium sp. A7-Y]MCW7537505.1 4'-phosphopantetheinyl transferase superfamily protein [Aquabacterium sp. A7-Y]
MNAPTAAIVDLSDTLGWPPVRLWWTELHAWPSALEEACLSAEERARGARFVFERDRRRYLAAHCALRAVLARHCGCEPAALSYGQGPQGKPFLTSHAGPAFNLSHSGDVALIGLAPEGELGVDVELLRPMNDVLGLARSNFSTPEFQALQALPPEQRELAFLTCWTRKEACLKALGTGLSLSPARFHAGVEPVPARVKMPTDDGVVELELRSMRHGPAGLISVAWRLGPPDPGPCIEGGEAPRARDDGYSAPRER